eukprot:g2489.t2
MQVDQLVLLFEKLFEDLGHIVRFLRSFSFLAVGPLKSLSLIHKAKLMAPSSGKRWRRFRWSFRWFVQWASLALQYLREGQRGPRN